MGCGQSKNFTQVKCKNTVTNADFMQQNSQQEENDRIQDDPKAFSNINQKHRNIINLAIASALKRLQSEVPNQTQEQQKKIISSLNRYYEQNKKKFNQVDAQNMAELDYQTILKTLKRHHLFKELFSLMNTEKYFLTKFLLSVQKKTFHFRDYIYKQFDSPTKFYIVAEGKLFIQLNSMGLKPLSRGQYFGLQSIIYDSEQGQSVKVKSSKAILYEIEKEEIIKVRQKISLKHKQQIRTLLQQKVIFFNFLDNKQKQKLLSQTVKSTYSKGQIIFQKDYDSNAYFVIKKGYVLIKIPQKKDLILEEGNSFGQSAFFESKGQRKGKALAYQDNTVIYAIGSRTIFKSLGNKLDCAVLHNLQKWSLYRDNHINQLYFTYNFDMQKLIHKFNVKKCQKYEVLARKGKKADKVFINIRCQINFSKDLFVLNSSSIKRLVQKYLKEKKKVQTNDEMSNTRDWMDKYFNQQNQVQLQQQDFIYESDIIVTEKGSYAQTTVQEVVYFIIEAIQEPQKHKNEKVKIDLSVTNVQKYIKLSERSSKTTILAMQKNFGIEHVIKIYNKNNQFNKSLMSKKMVCTLKKYQSNHQFQDQRDLRSIYQYMSIIQSLNYPHICGFYKAEQDDDNIYLLFQYIKGITLFQVQAELGIMPEIVIKFYILQLAKMLDYMHQSKIVYRDLKPDNVLIDNRGYPNLFDFKTAKRLKQNQNFKTHTMIGTPHYISPEIIQNKPYTFSTDYWQLGVLSYQLIYEKLPFANDLDDPVEIFTQILQKQPKLKKQSSSSFLKHLLQKNTQRRVKKFDHITKHRYFLNFQCQQVKNSKMPPPYIPKSISKRFKNLQVFVKNLKF